jgi:3'(2'), 5'-bisphosphate nucleotidase
MTRKESALAAVQRACRLTRSVQASLVSEETMAKKDRSPVTVADLGAQASISLDLGRSHPNDPIMGEEDATALRQVAHQALRDRVVEAVAAVHPGVAADAVLDAIDRCAVEDGQSRGYWVLDPIDGTKGFLRRGQYAVALAWLVDHQVQLSVLGCPELPRELTAESIGEPSAPSKPSSPDAGCILVAERGQGTMLYSLEGEVIGPARVSALQDLSQARFCESVEAAHSAHERHQRIADQLGVTADPVRIDSQCKYAALARGDAAIYLRLPRSESYQEKVWDHAAGLLAVEEAGGTVTDAEGKPLDFRHGRTLARNRGIVATHGPFHDQVIAAVRATEG